MREVFLAPWAKLADFNPVRVNPFVFRDRVVAALALATRQDDGFPWHISNPFFQPQTSLEQDLTLLQPSPADRR